MPGRLIIWTREDLIAWSTLLREAFPQVLFYEQFPFHSWEEIPEHPPSMILRETLADIEDGMGQIIITDRKWRPDQVLAQGPYFPIWTWARQPRVTGCHRGGSTAGATIAMPGSGKRCLSPTMLGEDVFLRYHRDDVEAKAMAMKALRLIGKMATNRLLVCDPKTLATKGPQPQRMYWAGHHAVRWCLDDPRRTLGYDFLPVEAQGRWPVPDIPGELEVINAPIRAGAADEAAYSAALLAAFPGIRFVDGPLWWRDPPSLRFVDAIAAATSAEVSLLFPSAGWEPQFALSPAGHWLIANRPFPHGTFTRSTAVTGRSWFTPMKPDKPDRGTLRFEWPAELLPAEVIARDATRLLLQPGGQ
jgi:hypothetical protein